MEEQEMKINLPERNYYIKCLPTEEEKNAGSMLQNAKHRIYNSHMHQLLL